jgi:hypothetical protein
MRNGAPILVSVPPHLVTDNLVAVTDNGVSVIDTPVE